LILGSLDLVFDKVEKFGLCVGSSKIEAHSPPVGRGNSVGL
jgi:hypothetical protein